MGISFKDWVWRLFDWPERFIGTMGLLGWLDFFTQRPVGPINTIVSINREYSGELVH